MDSLASSLTELAHDLADIGVFTTELTDDEVEYIETAAKNIFNSPTKSKGRSYETILDSCEYMASEIALCRDDRFEWLGSNHSRFSGDVRHVPTGLIIDIKKHRLNKDGMTPRSYWEFYLEDFRSVLDNRDSIDCLLSVAQRKHEKTVLIRPMVLVSTDIFFKSNPGMVLDEDFSIHNFKGPAVFESLRNEDGIVRSGQKLQIVNHKRAGERFPGKCFHIPTVKEILNDRRRSQGVREEA